MGVKQSCSIAIIIPYFGEWPVWIDLFFFSCGKNKSIDWFLFSDCQSPEVNYPNIKFIECTFENYCLLVSKKLNIDFTPSNPYLLCDLRPFYGYIHEDIIRNYNFWGFGDIDVVWGDIRTFYTDELLFKYDIFSTHADRMSGHLSILRNTKKFREICFNIPDWQKKLLSNKSLALDETYFSYLIYPESKYIGKIYSKILQRFFNWRNAWVVYYHLVPIINSILFIKARRFYFKEQYTTPALSDDGLSYKYDSDTWYYVDSKVKNNKSDKSFIYLHFLLFKKNIYRRLYYWKNNYYNIPKLYDFEHGVTINTEGFNCYMQNKSSNLKCFR